MHVNNNNNNNNNNWMLGYESPEIELYPESVLTVNSGDSATFQCRVVRGYPAPVLTWVR